MFDEINAIEYKNNNDMEHNLFPIRVTFKNTLYSKSTNPTPNFPVLAIRLYKYLMSVPHHLQKFAQMCVHCISDAILPSHPLTPFSPSALNLSQDQGLFQ